MNVLFVCYGNICRSPMAEFIFKDMIKRNGLENNFYIESAATSYEEIGNDMHYGTISKLKQLNIPFDHRKARRVTIEDYNKFDYILGMETMNVRDIIRIVGNDYDNKIYRLLDFSNKPRDIADPWYTGNFDITYKDILEGCNAFLNHIKGDKNG